MKTAGTLSTRWLWPVLACATLSSLQADPLPLREQLRDALYKEEVDRDPEAAAKGYQALLEENDAQRAFAATAQFRLAEVRRKQGRKDEAIAAYQTLLTRYPEAEAECRIAKENLKALGVAAEENATPAPAEDKDEQNLQRLIGLEKTAPDQLPGEFRQAIDDGYMKSLEFLITHSDPPPFHPGEDHEWPILFADRVESLAAVKVLLKHNPDPKDPGNRAALFSAAENNHVHIMKALLEAGLDPNAKPVSRYPVTEPSWYDPDTPLSLAIQKGNTEVMDLLLTAKADVNQPRDLTGQTALHYAIERGDAGVVKRLLDAGANPNAIARTGKDTDFLGLTSNESGYSLEVSPLDLAICKKIRENRDDNVIGILEKAGAKTHESRLLWLARNKKRVWEQLIAHGLTAASFKDVRASQLEADEPEYLRALLQHGLKLDPDDFIACLEKVSDETMWLILQQQAYDPAVLKEERLTSTTFRNPAVVAELIEKGMPVSDKMISNAVTTFNTELLRVLLEHGGNANAKLVQRSPGNPVLFAANEQSAVLLLEHGADINAPNSIGQLPLLYALNEGRTDLVKTLLEHGADPNVPQPGAAFSVARDTPPSVFPLLVEHGAEPDEAWVKDGFAGRAVGNKTLSLLFRTFKLPKMKESSDVTLVATSNSFIQSAILEPRSPSKRPRSLAEQIYGWTLNPNAAFKVSTNHWVIWRTDPNGGPRKRIDVDLTDPAAYPELEWGDIVDATEPATVENFSSTISETAKRHIRLSVTLEMDGVSYPYILNGNLDRFDVSKNEIPYLDTMDLMFLISQRKRTKDFDPNYKILRESWPPLEIVAPQNPKNGVPVYLTDGDRLAWKTREATAKDQLIRVSSPDCPYLKTVGFGSPDEYAEPKGIADTFDPERVVDAFRPTLLQAIAASYRSSGSGVLLHPDFSKLRIRRLDKECNESFIDVNLQERMEKLPDGFSAEQARAIDERLKCGDVLEIPVSKNVSPGATWQGFSPLMEKVMANALSYQVQITNAQHQVILGTIDYRAPRFNEDPHGPIKISPESGTDDPSLASLGGISTMAVVGTAGRVIGRESPGYIYPNGRDQYVEIPVPVVPQSAPPNSPRPQVPSYRSPASR